MALQEWYNPETGQVEMIDDGEPDNLSPWEQAHGGERYDPGATDRNAANDFDRAVDEYYNSGDELNRREDTNWYDPSSYEYLINQSTPTAGTTPTPTPTPPPPTPPPPPPPTPPPGPPGGPSFDLGPLLRPYPGRFQKPAFGVAAKQLLDLIGPTPEFTAPARPQITPFAFEDYTPTRGADVFTDPSFEFRKGIGETALLNNRAARGLTRSGGTLKDLLDYNQNFASQEFGNVDARRFRDYGARRGNAFDTWNANKDTTLGLYDRDFGAAQAEFEPKLYGWTRKGDLGTRAEERAYDNAFREFQTDYDQWRNQGRDVFDRLKWASEFGLDAATR